MEAGGEPDKYVMVPDDEEIFKAQMSVIKERRAKLFLEQEAEKQENLQKKLDIIERIKAMVTSPDDNKAIRNSRIYSRNGKKSEPFLQTGLMNYGRNYQLHVEQYYDLLNLKS